MQSMQPYCCMPKHFLQWDAVGNFTPLPNNYCYGIFFTVGQFFIPVSCLIEPPLSHLVREPNMKYIDALKEEMLNNPTGNVAPIIGVVHLKEEEQFDKKHPEAYIYETIGGNHSRIALQQLLKDHADLSDLYRFRMVSVYNYTITDEEAQHLSMRHNRATEFTNKLLTQDKVSGYNYGSLL